LEVSQIRLLFLITVSTSVLLNGCREISSDKMTSDTSVVQQVHSSAEKTKPPLADFSQVAQELVKKSPDGIAIGEVHGQIAGVMLLETVTEVALEIHDSVLILHEFTPQEAGLNLETTPQDDFQTDNLSLPSSTVSLKLSSKSADRPVATIAKRMAAP